jgi:2-methylisocitrate lyase-like PEP mutase family enzyme
MVARCFEPRCAAWESEVTLDRTAPFPSENGESDIATWLTLCLGQLEAPMSNPLAETFHQLHRQGLLCLANAWDAGSARVIEARGAAAIATTSAGLAWSQGYADGDCLPVSDLLHAVKAICRVVRVPVTIDIESGYSPSAQAVGETVAALIDLGVAGINIEDGDEHPDLLCAKIECLRTVAERLGVALFVNARTDVMLRRLATGDEALEMVLARAARYRESGADGLFVPYLSEPRAITAVVEATRLPLNLMAIPGLPAPTELARLGVRRLSAGSALAECVLGHVDAAAAAFLADGILPICGDALDYARINRLFATRN